MQREGVDVGRNEQSWVEEGNEYDWRRFMVSKRRKVVRNGELIKNQEHKARLMFEEKVKRLATMPVE